MAITLTMSQNDAIIRILKTDDTPDLTQLSQRICAEARVDEHVAEAYIRSWRYNHGQGGAIGRALAAYNERNPDAANTTTTSSIKKDHVVIDIDEKHGELPQSVVKEMVAACDKIDPIRIPSGICGEIVRLHISGKSNKEIIAMGYNKSTVGRQVSEYKKRCGA